MSNPNPGKIKICALIERASNLKETYRQFDSFEEMIKYMKETYHSFVVDLPNGPDFEYYLKKIKSKLGECDEYIHLLIYDDFIE